MAETERRPSRREFLAGGAAAAGAAVVAARRAPAAAARWILGANERVNLAILGLNGRGGSLMESFAGLPGVRVKTLVDVDQNLFAKYVERLDKVQAGPVATEVDLRRAFADKEVDAVVVATPDHWHALASIWAVQAGKHVYVEKPCCHTLWEGRRMVEEARRAGRLLAVGFQNRSIPGVRRAIQFLREGGIGEVYLARGLCYKPRNSIGRTPPSPVPPGVDYDLWLGPASATPFTKNRFHYNWHWFWEFGSGDIGNQGPHQFDVARWGLGKDEHPVKASSTGGCFGFASDQETPNTQSASFTYADGKMLQFEVRGLYTGGEEKVRIGNLFFGTKGWLVLDGSRWQSYLGRKEEKGPGSEGEKDEAADPANLTGAGSSGHLANFIAAVRSGKREDLTCEIEDGFLSSALPCLANIAYRTGRTLTFDGAKETFPGDGEASALLRRNEYRKPYLMP